MFEIKASDSAERDLSAIRDYLLIYRVDEDSRIVHIVRYFHGLQNYIAQL